MRWVIQAAQGVQEVSGRSAPVKAVWFVAMAYVFLWVPDLDLVLIEVLHHRSIVTHSILPALLLIAVGRRAGAAPIAGALIGLAVHLSCDLLSPMVGYGQVWLPAPVKTPLGPLSYLWLFINALLASVLARVIAMRAFHWAAGYALILLVGGATSVTYGWINEGSLPAVLVTLLVFGLSLLGPLRRLGLSPGARAGVAQAEQAVVSVLDGATRGLEQVSAGIEDFSAGLERARPFHAQRWTLEAIFDIAESRVAHQRELAADPALAAAFAEVERDWGAPNAEPVFADGLARDLLAEPAVGDEVRDLQAEHRTFLVNLADRLAKDSDLTAAFRAIVTANGGHWVLSRMSL